MALSKSSSTNTKYSTSYEQPGLLVQIKTNRHFGAWVWQFKSKESKESKEITINNSQLKEFRRKKGLKFL